jgi:hypothetical protein
MVTGVRSTNIVQEITSLSPVNRLAEVDGPRDAMFRTGTQVLTFGSNSLGISDPTISHVDSVECRRRLQSPFDALVFSAPLDGEPAA